MNEIIMLLVKLKLSNIYNKVNKCTNANPNETYDIIHSEIELNKKDSLARKNGKVQEIFS